MNHTYRLVWNQETQRYVPAPECAKGKGKTKALAPATILLGAVLALPAWAQTSAPAPAANQLPTGGQVVSGSAHIHQSGSQMQIQQGSQKAIIDWTSFNIGKDAAVTFQQPDTSAIALNRVTAGDASQIHGQLSANGQVWLINPNGIVFGQGSQVDVGGLVASTMNITNADFENGNYSFTRNGATGSITNQGELTAQDGGSIALLAPTVSNDGILRAQLGTVALAAGDKITLQAGANGLLHVEIDPATIRTLVENKQLIVADGGQVIMTGKAADQLSSSVVSNIGTIQANRLQEKDGKILLIADMQHGETKAAGTLEAHFIDTSAATVSIDQDLHINTAGGQWLIDPVDITIDQSKATAIETALGTGDVTVSTSNGHTNPGETVPNSGTAPGDIHVNADINYTQNKLTLNADNDINLNAAIHVNGSGTLALNYGGTQGSSSAPPATGSSINASFGANGGFAGKVNFAQSGSDLLAINGSGYTVIKDVTALQAMSSNPAGKYVLGGDINASSATNFAPIGSNSTRFTGTFDGLGHTISNLTIDRPAQGRVGLFGMTLGATLRNIGLVAADIEGGIDVGGLVGIQGGGSISNAYATGQVRGNNSVGAVGGLVGTQGGGSISNVYATGLVSGGGSVGGLVGNQNGGSIHNAYATGQVTSTGNFAGGLVGYQVGSISNAYATGSVSGSKNVGGLVGYQFSGSIGNAYATGSVSGSDDVGGLVGYQYSGSISSSYWNTETAGQAIQGVGGVGRPQTGVTGKTTEQLKQLATFTGWDIADAGGTGTVWRIYEGHTGPLLRSFLKPTTVTAAISGVIYKTYDGTAVSGSVSSYTTNVTGAALSGTLRYTTNSKNAGNYRTVDGSLKFTGLYSSDQQGYDISYVASNPAMLTIGKAALTVTGMTANNKTYDGGTVATLSGGSLSGVMGSDSVTFSNQTGTFADKNAGTGKTVTVSGITLGGTDAANYTVTQPTGLTADISAKALTVTGMAANNKTYDGSTVATLSGGILSGVIGLDSVTLGSSTGTFADKNAGTGKAVTVSGITLGGTDAANYTVTQPTGLTADISAKALTVTGMTANSKTYDGGTVATLSGGILSGVIGLDSVTLGSSTGTFADKNVGTGKAVTASGITLGGTDAGNYTVTQPTGLTADISAKALTVAGMTANSKTYDGGTVATLSGGSLSGVMGSDSVTFSNQTGTFADKNVGTGKAVTVSGITLDGTDAGNYTVTQPTGLTADITAKALTVTGMAADNKTYDGNANATLNGGSLDGVIGLEDVTFSGQSGAFADKNVGTGKTVTVSGITLGGTDAANYTVIQPTGLTADISAKALTVTGMTANNKTYDGGTVATLSGGILSGVIGLDSVTLGSSTGTFADKNVGTGKTVSASGITLDGADAGNYTVTQPTGLTADIGQAALQITANDASKTQGDALVLNGSTGFTVDAGLVAGEAVDSVQLSSPGTPASAAVGSYAITASNATGSSGFDANNYAITYTDGTLTVTASPVTPPPVVPPVEPPTPLPPAGSLPSGGAIWLAQNQREDADAASANRFGWGAMPAAQLQAGGAGSVPYLALAPDFIRMQDEE